MSLPTRPIRALIVDDHAVVRSGYRLYLEREGRFEVVGEAGSADEAYQLHRKLEPDIVIMDIQLPGASGIDASRRILSADPRARILVFSMYAEPVFVQQALDLGVLGAVGKDSPPEVLHDAALAVAQGRRYLGPEVAQSLVFSRYDEGRRVFESLSPREFEIFQLLVDGKTVDAIAETLSLSAKTVANRLSIVRQKLGVSSDIHLVKLAATNGLVPWLQAAAREPGAS